MAVGEVFGNPVLPLSAQPEGSKLTFEQKKANGIFIAWYMYNYMKQHNGNPISYEFTIGLVSAIYQESECDPTQYTKAGPAMGLPQLVPYTRWESVFNDFGYTLDPDWLDVVKNMYCQCKYMVSRFTNYNLWFTPVNLSACNPPYIIRNYELSMDNFLKSTEPGDVAGCLAVMSLRPGEINQVYRDYAAGLIDHDEAEIELQKWISYYQRMIPGIRQWYSEQSLLDYIAPEEHWGMSWIYYMKPTWRRIIEGGFK